LLVLVVSASPVFFFLVVLFLFVSLIAFVYLFVSLQFLSTSQKKERKHICVSSSTPTRGFAIWRRRKGKGLGGHVMDGEF
jgi:hypothetical protein